MHRVLASLRVGYYAAKSALIPHCPYIHKLCYSLVASHNVYREPPQPSTSIDTLPAGRYTAHRRDA